MQIAFCSNFLSAHQRPLCDALYANDVCDFRFIATQPLSEIRKSMGWEEETVPYVIASYKSDEEYRQAVDYVKNADVVLLSGDEETDFFKLAIHNPAALIFRCCERVYKTGRWRAVSPRGLLRRWHSYGKQPKKNLYLLCCSAYAAGDFAILGSYLGHAYKWGYFTATQLLDIEQVLNEKEENHIFWAGRMLDWKHPEAAIYVAEHLHKRNIPFRLDMAGDGPMRESIQRMIEEKGLTAQVHLLGMLSQEETSSYMRKSSIFLATSDYFEGWGAVVSEAMSCGCAVVASEAMGAVPFLIQDGQNGYSFKYKAYSKPCQVTEDLLTNKQLRHRIGRNAYETMVGLWNPELAANRLIQLITALKSGEDAPFASGPCSKARIFRKGR